MERTAGRTTTKRAAGIILRALQLAVASPAFAQVVAQSAKPAEADPIHRVVLVSIPDRKLAVIENGNVIADLPGRSRGGRESQPHG